MQFKVIVNVVLLCIIVLDSLLIVATTFMLKKGNNNLENKIEINNKNEKILKIRTISYLVFFGLLIVMMIFNIVL